MPNGIGRVETLTPLSPLVRLIQRYASPHKISPSASVIMMKLMPVARSDSAAKPAVKTNPTASAARMATVWP